MKAYQEILAEILTRGTDRPDRTGTGVRSAFGITKRFNLQDGFPAVTVKRLAHRTALREVLWFLKGTASCDYLDEVGCKVWKEWTDPETNSVGPMYGVNLRAWPSTEGPIDQVAQLVEQLKTNPYSRRHVMTTWNPAVLPDETLSPIENVRRGKAALASCHGVVIQYYVEDVKDTQGHPRTPRLNCSVYIRSSDTILGLPFNIAQYAYLTHMLAHLTEMQVGELIVTLGDANIYNNHMHTLPQLLKAEPYPLPRLVIKRTVKSIDDFKEEDFELVGYEAHDTVKVPVSV